MRQLPVPGGRGLLDILESLAKTGPGVADPRKPNDTRVELLVRIKISGGPDHNI